MNGNAGKHGIFVISSEHSKDALAKQRVPCRNPGGQKARSFHGPLSGRGKERGRESFRRPSREDDSRPPFLSPRPLLFPCFAWTAVNGFVNIAAWSGRSSIPAT